MDALPHALYTAEQVRELDRIAIQELGIPAGQLMDRAGAAAFAELRLRWPAARRVLVLAGPGNNGGDGIVLAHLAHEAGMQVELLLVGDEVGLRGAAGHALRAARAVGIDPRPFRAVKAPLEAEVIVDALLGTGLDRPVEGEWRAAVDAINRAGVPVLALDVPSGLNADTGAVLGAAVEASATVSFIGLKQGLFTGEGPAVCGDVCFNDLGIPSDLYDRTVPSAVRLRALGLERLLSPRRRTAHKGAYGHVLLVGGEYGMAGAVRLAGEAAARTGAGLVTIATRSEHAAALAAARPELMAHPVENATQLRPLLARATVIGVGPGLGQSAWARELLCAVYDTNLPIVADADALNLLARAPMRLQSWVLTPHPGEAGRLLGVSAGEVQSNRFAAIRSIQARYGGVCVLKGPGTLVWDGESTIGLCDAGNPGMASGGMGDVLTGVIAGLIAQGSTLGAAAELGVYLHALAADAAARDGERGLLASDLIAQLRGCVNLRGGSWSSR